MSALNRTEKLIAKTAILYSESFEVDGRGSRGEFSCAQAACWPAQRLADASTKKKPSGRSPDGLFPQLPARSRFHRRDFSEADGMRSFQPLIVRWAGSRPPSAPTIRILIAKIVSTTVRQN
jgi:hypothetical protein